MISVASATLHTWEADSVRGVTRKSDTGAAEFRCLWLIPLSNQPYGNTVPQLVRKFHAFHGTRKFVTMFTKAYQIALSWARSIQSMLPPSMSWRASLILSSHLHLGCSSGLFPRFPHQNPVCTSLLPFMCSISCTSPILLIQSPNCWRTVQSMKLFITYFPPVSSNLLFLRPKYLPQHPLLQHSQSMFLTHVCD